MSFRRRRNLIKLIRSRRFLLRRNDKIDEYKKKIPKSLNELWDLYVCKTELVEVYNSNAFLGFPPQSNSTGFSKASLTATKNPTDSRPSIILWS